MSETVDGVEIKCDEPLEVFRQEKNAVKDWKFVLKTKVFKILGRCCLHLYIRCRNELFGRIFPWDFKGMLQSRVRNCG